VTALAALLVAAALAPLSVTDLVWLHRGDTRSGLKPGRDALGRVGPVTGGSDHERHRP
jgi:hypothetical protein